MRPSKCDTWLKQSIRRLVDKYQGEGHDNCRAHVSLVTFFQTKNWWMFGHVWHAITVENFPAFCIYNYTVVQCKLYMWPLLRTEHRRNEWIINLRASNGMEKYIFIYTQNVSNDNDLLCYSQADFCQPMNSIKFKHEQVCISIEPNLLKMQMQIEMDSGQLNHIFMGQW